MDNNNVKMGDYAHQEGLGTQALGMASHAEGHGYDTFGVAVGEYSHSEGDGCNATMRGSHAEGIRCVSGYDATHAEGYYTKATASLGEGAHSEGFMTEATGNYGSHAEGRRTKAVWDSCHAEGAMTQAGRDAGSGQDHAEGLNTKAYGGASHSEGDSSESTGYASHSEGGYTLASGSNSHAEGWQTQALGTGAHSANVGTIANAYGQTAIGKFNIKDDTTVKYTTGEYGEGKYAVIVGNGSEDSKRSNAATLDWEGNAVVAGKITVGSNPTDDMDVATKKYIDEKIEKLKEWMLLNKLTGKD